MLESGASVKNCFRTALESLTQVGLPYGLNPTGISMDSRTLQKGEVFCAYAAGAAYIPEAISRGASCVLYDSTLALCKSVLRVPAYPVDDLRAKVGFLASTFYGNPSKQLSVVGVTGTNGKTTTCWLLAKALTTLESSCAIMGTLGNGMGSTITASPLTTQDPVSLQNQLKFYLDAGATHVAMEVSSHAIDQCRVGGLSVDVGIFTNLSRDHLDYHETMQAYADVKRRWFLEYGLENAVINIDDEMGRELYKQVSQNIPTYSYSATASELSAHIRVKSIEASRYGTNIIIVTPIGDCQIHSQLLGRFNVENLLAALGALLVLGFPPKEAAEALSLVENIPGRMALYKGLNGKTAVIDYAHTPDALASVLKTLQSLKEDGRLICVFGCGGDRDVGKRAEMARVAEQFSDGVFVTDDNPRTENPDLIFDDIARGFEKIHEVHMLHDRKCAIEAAWAMASDKDIIVIAGKGHESYQIVGHEYLPLSDADVVRSLIDTES